MISNKYKDLEEGLKSLYKFSESEIAFLKKYKTNCATELNRNIRENRLSHYDLEFINNLNEGLTKLATGNIKIIYRHLLLCEFQINKLLDYFSERIGTTIKFLEFLSCSELRYLAGREIYFNCVFEISTLEQSKGKNLGNIWRAYGLTETEKEILFPTETCFKIIEVIRKGDLKIKLKEVENIKKENINHIPSF